MYGSCSSFRNIAVTPDLRNKLEILDIKTEVVIIHFSFPLRQTTHSCLFFFLH